MIPSVGSMSSYGGVYSSSLSSGSPSAHSTSSAPMITLSTFIDLIIPARGLPRGLEDCIFAAFDFSNRSVGLSYEDFMTAFAVLTKGTESQKTRLLFYVYDVAREGEVKRCVCCAGVCTGVVRVAHFAFDNKFSHPSFLARRRHKLLHFVEAIYGRKVVESKQTSQGETHAYSS